MTDLEKAAWLHATDNDEQDINAEKLESFKAGGRRVLNSGEVLAMQEALVWCEEFFAARDEMNAQVHCAPVRLSPLTERVQLALAAFRKIRGKE